MRELALIPLGIALSAGLIFQMMPGRGKRFLFQVPVADSFRASDAARGILLRFTLLNWAVAALAGFTGAAGLWMHSQPLIIGWPLLHAAAGVALYQFFRAQVAPYSVPHPPAGATSAADREPILPWWGWMLFVLPLVLLGGATYYLADHWDQIPERFAVHFGIDGKPNRWAERSFKGVFGPLLIGLSSMLLIYGIGVMTALGGPRGGAATARLIRTTMLTLAGGGIFSAGLVSWIALRPLTAEPDKMPNPLWILLPVVAGIVGLVVALWKVSSEAEEEGAAAPAEGWWLSSVYFNRADPAMMVQRRIGFGFTPNFAHPTVQLLMPLLVAQMLAMIYYVAR